MEDCIARRECDACKDLYDAKIEGIDGRLKIVEEDVKQIHALAISVEKMAVSLEHMAEELKKQGRRLNDIETEPAKNWKSLIWYAVTFVIGAVLTFVFTHIGL